MGCMSFPSRGLAAFLNIAYLSMFWDTRVTLAVSIESNIFIIFDAIDAEDFFCRYCKNSLFSTANLRNLTVFAYFHLQFA